MIGGVDLQHVAEMSGVPPNEICTWEGLFFDVRACRNRPGWIRSKLIRPLEEAGQTTFAAGLKVALAGGASTAQLVIEADGRVPVEEAERILDAELKLHQKLVEATDIPLVGSANAVQLLTAHRVTGVDYDFRKRRPPPLRLHRLVMHGDGLFGLPKRPQRNAT